MEGTEKVTTVFNRGSLQNSVQSSMRIYKAAKAGKKKVVSNKLGSKQDN